MAIIIRKAEKEDAPGIAKVHVDSWRETYEGIVPREYLASLSYQRSQGRIEHRIEHIPAYAMYVAQTPSGEIVGFVDGGPERSEDDSFDAELYSIYLLKAHQRQGIGTSLVRGLLLQHLIPEKFRAIKVWVLADNPSRLFYEALGGRSIGESTIELSGTPLREVAFGWSDLHALAASLG